MLRPGVDAIAFREPSHHPPPAGSVRSEPGGSRLLAARLLERNLVRLGRAGTNVDRRVALRLRRLCERRLYRPLGYARLVDYLTERLGMSARRCQSILRLERVVEALPLLGRALQGGEVSLSKVETVSRVATAANEGAWLERARRLSVSSLRELVRTERDGVDKPEQTIEQDEPGRLVTFAAPASTLAVWHWTLDLVRRVAGRQEPAWRCAEYLAAEYLSGVPDVAAAPAPPDPPAPREAPPVATSVAGVGHTLESAPREADPNPSEHAAWLAACDEIREALVSIGEAVDIDAIESDAAPAGKDDEVDAWALDAQLRRLVRLRQSLAWRQGRLLAALACMRLHRELGFGALDDWIGERLVMSPRRARYLIALDRRLRELPLVADAYRRGLVSWCQARLLVRVVAPATQRRWIRYARRVTVRRLEDVVVACESESSDPRAIVSPQLPPDDPDGLQTSAPSSHDSAALQTSAPQPDEASERAPRDRHACRRISFWAPLEVAALWDSALRACRAANGARLEDWECFLSFVQALRDTWDNPDDPQWKRRYRIFERDGWRCMAPGCTSRSALNEHHIVFRSHQGSDDDANLVTLCIGHHQEGVHAGYLRCFGRAPDRLWWELGIRSSGEPLLRYFGDRIVGRMPCAPVAARESVNFDERVRPRSFGSLQK